MSDSNHPSCNDCTTFSMCARCAETKLVPIHVPVNREDRVLRLMVGALMGMPAGTEAVCSIEFMEEYAVEEVRLLMKSRERLREGIERGSRAIKACHTAWYSGRQPAEKVLPEIERLAAELHEGGRT